MKLYGYWRSSAAYRVRIALHLKQIECEHESVHLVKEGGQQHHPDYVELNPMELVPTLVDGELTLNQSMAILDYLEAKYPQTPLLPKALEDKVQAKAIAYDIACDIHPVNNLRILQYLTGPLGHSDEEKVAWYKHWVDVGFASLDKKLQKTVGQYCYGNEVSWADICLIPQVYNAERFNVDMTKYPTIKKIADNCRKLDAFIKAAPENQPDAVS